MKKLIIVLSILFVASCGSLQSYKSISQPIGVARTVSIGSKLYRVTKTRDLPNAFGKADIFGGKIKAGYTDLRFMGVTKKGEVIFRLTDVDIESNETTMSRYGHSSTMASSNTSVNATYSGNSIYGSSNTNTIIKHYEKPKSSTIQLHPNTVEFFFDPKEKVLNLEDISIKILSVTNHSITYLILKA